LKVLLVDDEEEFVTALTERFLLRGIDADCVTSGIDAVRVAQQIKYDVVVVDVKMPELCGFDVMETIRKEDPNVKFIFMTGHSSEDSLRACKEAGACDYLIKPVKIEVLIEKVLEAAQE
jgi:DNA-binding response OmpR family regulator